MHNNFLVERSGKMSKSSGEFLRLQLLVDKGYHPLAYRMMCLQAHYRSELEFSWEGLGAALVRLKRLVMAVQSMPSDTALKNARQSPIDAADALLAAFEEAVSDDLNTPLALTIIDQLVAAKGVTSDYKKPLIAKMDKILGLRLFEASREDLRIRPQSVTITEFKIIVILTLRNEARAAKDFATSDALRDQLAAQGVEVMDGDPLDGDPLDGDPLGWDWKLG